MARTQVPVQAAGPYAVGIAALTATSADNVNNHYISANDGNIVVVINNGSAGPVTVTGVGIATARTFNTAPAPAVTVAAGAVGTLGPFPIQAFNQTDGSVQFNVSAGGATIKLSAVQLVATPS